MKAQVPRAKDLHHPAARQAAHTQRDIQAQRSGGDDVDLFDHLAVTQPHDRAFAELLFDLQQRSLQGLGFFGVEGFDRCVHRRSLLGLLSWQRLCHRCWMFVQCFRSVKPRVSSDGIGRP
jgi:hypothetical protein